MDLVSVRTVRTPSHRDDLALAPGEQPLAGGTWLYSVEQPGTTGLVDLTGLGWPDAERTPDGLRLGATCTLAALLRLTPEPDWRAWPLVDRCVNALLASFKVWNAATVGGNVATALPAGAVTALLVTLDATAVVWTTDGGERRVPVAELVTGPRTTTLAPGEVVRAFDVPVAALRQETGYRRVSLSPHGRTGTLVTARWRATDRVTGTGTDVSATTGADDGAGFVLVVTGGVPRPLVLRWDAVPTAAAVDAALADHDDWYDDPHGSPTWRRGVSRRFAAELVAEAGATGHSGNRRAGGAR
ncbi:CO/xanthine dehydrogenase FAD-binding subunit [Curtobacterium sp. AG1037]|uniref:FAD binding domain-containing protein n=1 Tax=Curtobacterium sp. AG1037 TaxID=2183990 RepID=UPI000E0B4B93|nr:FAD binding domain-containing protein [Curtobacterium sp. AG1037]RDH97827.1 CO/xanthine dehydrogenase FAD-binding subunit [Curtobacterium sp. AG1037]